MIWPLKIYSKVRNYQNWLQLWSWQKKSKPNQIACPKPCLKVRWSKALSLNQPIPRQDVSSIISQCRHLCWWRILVTHRRCRWHSPDLISDKTSHVQRCIQSLEPIQSPKSTKNLPLPKLRIRRSQEGFISELTEPTKSQNDVTIVNDVIDLCEDDEPEVIAIQDPQSMKKSSNTTSLGFDLSTDPSVVPEATGRPRRNRQPPKRFEDFRTGNTPKTKIFKVSSNFSLIWVHLTFHF